MKTVYLIPCNCGQKVSVDASQAGARVACACGQQLVVPTFRGLKQLESVVVADAVTDRKKTGWNPVVGVIFSLGMLAALIGGIFFGFNFYFYTQTRGGAASIESHMIEDNDAYIAELGPDESFIEFRTQEAEKLEVAGTPGWVMLDAFSNRSYRWSVGAGIVSLVGILMVVGSLLLRPKPRTT